MGIARNYEAWSGTSGVAVVLTPDFDAPAKAWVLQNTSTTATDEITFTITAQAIKVRGGQTKRIALVADDCTVTGSGAGYVVRAADTPGAIAVAIESAGGGGGGADPDTPQAITAAGPTDVSSATVLVNYAGAATVNLPAGLTVGKAFSIKDSSGAAATNNISITTAGSETIDGSATATISANYASVTLVTDGSNWFIT